MGSYSKTVKTRVISIEEGSICGKVIDFLVDYKTYQVKGFIVKGGWNNDADVVMFKDIMSFGDDVIMVKNAKMVQPASKVTEAAKAIKDRIDITKIEVITNKGHVLGKIADFDFSTSSGKIERFEIGGSKYLERLKNFFEGKGSIAVEDIIAIGKDAMVVADDKKKADTKKEEKKEEKKEDKKEKPEEKAPAKKKKTAKKKTAKKKSAKKKE